MLVAAPVLAAHLATWCVQSCVYSVPPKQCIALSFLFVVWLLTKHRRRVGSSTPPPGLPADVASPVTRAGLDGLLDCMSVHPYVHMGFVTCWLWTTQEGGSG